jgi:AcrR family transcriptional regulator
VHEAILRAAFELVLESGLRAVTIEAIAAKAKVGKTTIYRRWPNKAAVIMDAFTARVEPEAVFRKAPAILDSIRWQMRSVARAFNGTDGDVVKSLIAEAQFDSEVAAAFQERWTLPRRRRARAMIEEAVHRGELPTDVDPERVIDLLYAPIYYRLLMGTGPLSEAYIDRVFEGVMYGLSRGSKQPS